MNLGRVMIAAFMVAIFLGPRRWMAWAAGLRERIRVIGAVLRARRAPGVGGTPPSPAEPLPGVPKSHQGGAHESQQGADEPPPGA